MLGWAKCSRCRKQIVSSDRGRLPMLDAISNYAKGKRGDLITDFVLGRSIGQDARQLRNFADPAAIVFAFDFNC